MTHKEPGFMEHLQALVENNVPHIVFIETPEEDLWVKGEFVEVIPGGVKFERGWELTIMYLNDISKIISGVTCAPVPPLGNFVDVYITMPIEE